MEQKFYGPDVYCPMAEGVEFTHSPHKEGPWFCFVCGETDHEVIKRKEG